EEREFYLGLFQRFAVRMRNDWFTNRYPHWYPLSNSVMNSVEWQDELTGDNIHYRYETSRLADLYWPLNRTRLSVYPEDERHLEVFLDTFTPNFSHFNLTLNSAVGSEVREVKKNKIKWRLEPGLNILQVAAVNDRAVEGRLARVEILLGPDGGEKGEGGE
ncbi:MAG: hypothetical protein U9P14_10915, partial [Gemmatimonadota bacterium]|nr:hypothetical protein [Gemmatimonadota bacterium]